MEHRNRVETRIEAAPAPPTDSPEHARQQAELRKWRRQQVHRLKRRGRWYAGGTAAVAITSILTGLFTGRVVEIDALTYGLLCLPSFATALFLFYCFVTQKTIRAEIAALANKAGLRAVGPLLELLDTTVEAGIENSFYNVLAILLPRMQFSDIYLLNRSQRAILNRLLLKVAAAPFPPHSEFDFAIAALRALEQVGDTSALPAVRRITQAICYTPTQRRIRQAARDCLPALQQNSGSVRKMQDLLRPSQAPEDDPASLLHPLTTTDPTPPDQLLRSFPPNSL